MSRPTIASLEAEVRRLKEQNARAGEHLIRLYDNATYSERQTIEEIAGLLRVTLDVEREISVTVIITGTVTCPSELDAGDLVFTLNGREVTCADLGVEGFESDISFEVTDSYWE